MSLKYGEIISKMTLEEKARMMSGKNTWETVDFPQYGIPSMAMSDGPHGLRRQGGSGDHLGLGKSLPATCFPTAATVANSWDESLGEAIGTALAEEAVTMDVNVILGPGLNIKRSPLCGRNFEYFSEDPYHAGKMAAAYVKGIQSKGISACPKHFAANSQELRRMAMNSVVDERTFREIYTTGFEIAIKEGKSKSIMSAYNEINSVYANENKHLLREILVDEWGFDGYVVSDWGGSNDHALGVACGSHLEMPGTGDSGMKDIIRAVENGTLAEEVLDERLDELLGVIFATHQATEDGKGKIFDVEKHHELARKVAEESVVLLKNEENILPLAEGTKVAVIGDFAKAPRYQGAGSSLVNPTKTPEAIVDVIGESGLVMQSYAQGYVRNRKTNQKLLQQAVEAAKAAETVLIFAGLDEISESEGLDRVHMHMPQAQDELIEAVAAVNDNVIVVLSAGSAVEMPWFDKVKAIVHGYLGGQAGASAMLRVLTGKYNPSGKLNETYPYHYEDTPAYAYYPSKERSSEYRESLYVGYRYYTTVGKAVRFPFGYGLSYTTFTYSNLHVEKNTATFTLKNTGERDGAEIAQLYIGRKSDTVFRPVKELKGFAKVFLRAGEEKEVTIALDDKAFRFFDVRTNTWEIETGNYTVYVGANVEDTPLMTEIYVDGTVAEGGYDKASLPDYFTGRIENVSDNEYRVLYGREVPDGSWSGEIHMNDAVCQLYYGKGIFGKLFCGVLKLMVKFGEWQGKPNLNVLFNYNMPIRGYAKMTNGIVTMDMARALTEMANGHRIKGTGHFIKVCVKR
ncbi:MAG: glycoside hydrolase family 3 C-terminal domain-containing protein [Clostridiales bacterium]|nr:glycoside hydrolase family 3 C-terminal domain-containing protein [Roseburia sp.]MDD7636668.1 glycoside hydrolase family 3 C-terminal domain-containing protein [Clostridiales bacterium]MDY4111649.1 glycoside hydrolase family 3 C-terminal domain-containing protein [Roseburia sp.]